jgi:UPF0176 protein
MTQQPDPDNSGLLTASFYRFASLPDCEALATSLHAKCAEHGVLGNVLLAAEGINGSIAGPAGGVHAVLDFLQADARLAPLQLKTAVCDAMPFYRLKVRTKPEIVTMGVPEVDPVRMAGQHVAPQDWNALLARPGMVLVDVRNGYEVGIGTFEGAIDPGLDNFAQWPQWVAEQSAGDGVLADKPAVAMFCTGGIRCEKASALLRMQGFAEVYHLEGGILRYLETVPPEQSRWNGECFVFDERVAVGQGLAPGSHSLCRSCRRPLNAEDLASPLYEAGVRCGYCSDARSEEQQRAYRERQRQMELAAQRGQLHVGAKLGAGEERRQAQSHALSHALDDVPNDIPGDVPGDAPSDSQIAKDTR